MKARKVLKYEMGVNLSKNIYGDDFDYDDEERNALVNGTSRGKLEKLKKKRAKFAADLSSEKPILLERNSRNNIARRHNQRHSSNGKKGKTRGGKNISKRRNIAREYDFSGRH